MQVAAPVVRSKKYVLMTLNTEKSLRNVMNQSPHVLAQPKCRQSNRARHSLIEQIELLHSAACLQLPFQQNVQALYDII